MSIKLNNPKIFLAISILLFSYTNSAIASGNRFCNSSFASRTLKLDTGHVVSLDSAQACIDRFPAFMAAHGFASQAGQSINLRLKKTSQLTTGENFDGAGLQDWLNQTAAAYTAAGKTMMVRVALGVYDMNYLNTYQPNAALRSASNNRIAIFIIPYDASTGQAVKALAAQPAGSGSGGTGYDFGGLQP